MELWLVLYSRLIETLLSKPRLVLYSRLIKMLLSKPGAPSRCEVMIKHSEAATTIYNLNLELE